MTQYLNDPDRITNYFDDLLRGVGHRGSSFMDIDRADVMVGTHDGATDRFLFQELKHHAELASMRVGQSRLLAALAKQPAISVWLAVRRDDGQIGWRDYALSDAIELISPDEYRRRFAGWWNAGARRPAMPIARRNCKHHERFIDNGVCWICSHSDRHAEQFA